AALNTVPIETIALGRRTLGENPEMSDAERRAFVDPDPATWRELRFRMTKADGGGLDVHLLRPVDWIAAAGAAVGRTVHLDLAELGAAGPAECLFIGPCPAIEPGAGNVVTGLFRHHSVSNLLDLSVEGDPTPTGVTASHPYWSVDREAFIPAGDLQIGERLRRADGTTAAVLRLTPRPDEPVFNLEVHGEHVYRVGADGVLVHNSYGRNVPPRGGYVPDFQTRNTVRLHGWYDSEGQARQLARTKLGPNPVDVGDNKLRSIDGRWQYRAKPIDTTQNHVHIEQLDPTTGEVLQNWHLHYPPGASR
ncbi:MAG: polymorphic toxin-type HINT domain-containing protein, partial [Planctomycetia bacterium]